MGNSKQAEDISLVASHRLLAVLETLPDALIVIDEQATILYANATAVTRVGATQQDVLGNSLWQCFPPLISLELYQAVTRVLHTRESLQIVYPAPITSTWLSAYLLPTPDGITLLVHETTEPPPLQDALHQYDQMPRDILEELLITVVVLTPEGIILNVNQAPLTDAGLQRADVLGKRFAETPWWSYDFASQQRLYAAIEQASRGKVVRFEARVRSLTEMYLDRSATLAPHLDEHGRVEYLIYISSDITAFKQAEEEFRSLVDAMPQFVWVGGPDGDIEYYNQRWRDYGQLSMGHIEGDEWSHGLHPDDLPKALGAWQTAIQRETLYKTELRLYDHATGAYRWFLARGAPYRDALQGRIVKWVGTLTDIEEQKQVEQDLKASQEKFRVLAETVPQMIWATRADGYLEYWNQRYIEYLQVSPEELRGYGWRSCLHPGDYASVVATRADSLVTGEPYEIAYRLREGRTGTYRRFLARGIPVRDDAGQIVAWFGTCTDIEEQKRIEDALRQSQERARTLMESAIMGIMVIDGETLVEVNSAFLQMTGYSREEVQSGTLKMSTLIPPEYAPHEQQILEELTVSRQVKPYETVYICKDGSLLPILQGGVALPHHPSQTIGFVLDNSARKELEQRKDDFLSMASHELKTPLTSLKLQTQLLGRQLAKQEVTGSVPAFARMDRQVKHLERLVGELLDVSRIQAGKLESVQETFDLDELLTTIAEALQQISTTHTVVVHGAVQISLIGDRDRLGQVFTNLISNAIKYSPAASTVEVEVSVWAETVTISVRDQGIGIPQEQREKIFERFYRAVTPDQKGFPGFGMGLYIVAEIIKQHEGTIAVESEVGKGSTFVVTLPRKDGLSLAAAPALQQESEPGARL